MAATFERTNGDIASVLLTMFSAPAFAEALGQPPAGPGKFKDPMQFIVSSLRLAHDGTAISNYRPLFAWLRRLGEPLYGRVTPEGYALVERAWASPGQMVARFEIARAIGGGHAELFKIEASPRGREGKVPTLNNDLFRQAIAPTLGTQTRDALSRTSSEPEWNMVLLAAPEWMRR